MKKQRGFGLIIYAVMALAILGALAGLYALVDHSWETSAGIERGEANKQTAWDKANREQREREAATAATASTQLETGNAEAKIIYREITKSVDKYIDRPVYRNVCFDADGLRDANAALSGARTPAGKPDEPLPASRTAFRWEWRLSAAQGDRGG